MDTTGTYQSSTARAGRNSSMDERTVPEERLSNRLWHCQPDIMTFWLGANDVLGYATTGGTSPAAPTRLRSFTALYTQAMTSIAEASLPNVKIVVGISRM